MMVLHPSGRGWPEHSQAASSLSPPFGGDLVSTDCKAQRALSGSGFDSHHLHQHSQEKS